MPQFVSPQSSSKELETVQILTSLYGSFLLTFFPNLETLGVRYHGRRFTHIFIYLVLCGVGIIAPSLQMWELSLTSGLVVRKEFGW